MVEQYIYSSADFPADLKCQTLSFLRVEWPEGFVGENRLRDWITAESEHPLHLVLVEAGLLISHTNVVWKYLEHAGVTYKTYGLTGVFTYPSFRGQGYGSRIVAAGTATIQASDADIAMFHCDHRLRDFYGRQGWEALEQATTYIGPRDKPVLVEDEILMMLFLSPKGQQGRPSFE
ncbi:MAG: GNAT family N-acetyltransferase, partial [Chloroflexi bacterium]|nr:GNAT family N-acetyltransferase [Chloroflexota bacterium]MCI0731584.1 GNAT family N-acetyltransferase [Chloroflexota bacterium]